MKKKFIDFKHISIVCIFTFLGVFSAQAQTITSYPYVEDFESGPAGWTVHGIINSWQLGTPSNNLINSAVSGENAWITNLTDDYSNSEYGYVQSPSFDLTGLTTPYIQFNIWWEFESGDGGSIETSIDSGSSWQTLISSGGNTPSGEIINWMNGTFPFATNGAGWIGSSSRWITAIYPLESLAGETNVIFRVLYGTNGSLQNNGFAFDRFQISDSYCYAGEDEDYYNNDFESEWITCVDNGSSKNLNTILDEFNNATNRSTAVAINRWQFLSGPIGPRGPNIPSFLDEDDLDFPNTGAGVDQLFKFKYTLEDEQCEDSANINICMFSSTASGSEERTIYIGQGEQIENAYELFNTFSLDSIRCIGKYGFDDCGDLSNTNQNFNLLGWQENDFSGNFVTFPRSNTEIEGIYYVEDETTNSLIADVKLITSSDKNLKFSFANAINTNDGTNDYFEVDVMIQTIDTNPVTSFKLGNGQLFFSYNPLAFGEYVNAYRNIEITHPNSEGYLAGQPIDLDPNTPMYTDFRILDNTQDSADNWFSWSFNQNGSTSSTSIGTDNITNTAKKLCHIKIKYQDVHLLPMLNFKSTGIYDNKFTDVDQVNLLVNDSFGTEATFSTNNFVMLDNLSLYPNPTKDMLFVKGNISQLKAIEIYSITGKRVVTLNHDFESINISPLQAGMYFVKLRSENASKTVKIIKN